jgi:large subunit ribosomal protein L29
MTNKLDTRSLSDEQLVTEIESAQRDYVTSKMQHATSGLSNPSELREMRKDIARLLTEARGREINAMSAEQLANRSKIRARRK